jgi:hypothetical protein
VATKPRNGGSHIDDPRYWRARAATARATAEKMIDPTARRTMLGISRSYEDLARRTQARIAGAKSGKPPSRNTD